MGLHLITSIQKYTIPFFQSISFQVYGIWCIILGSPFKLSIPWGRRQPWFDLRSVVLFNLRRMWYEETDTQSIKIKCNLCIVMFKLILLKLEAEFKTFIMIYESPNIWRLLCPTSLVSWQDFRRANNYAWLLEIFSSKSLSTRKGS